MGGERRGVEGRSEAGEGEWVVRKCRHEGISWRAFKNRTGTPCLVLEKASCLGPGRWMPEAKRNPGLRSLVGVCDMVFLQSQIAGGREEPVFGIRRPSFS